MADRMQEINPSALELPPAHNTQSQARPCLESRSSTGATERTVRPGPDPRDDRRNAANEVAGPDLLPARKVFPIQIGDRLFGLSGTSIASNAPSAAADNVRTLYIDRDPATFKDIALHLRGYHVEPRDGTHFVKLFAGAQFFSLPRLTQQLFDSAICIRIGKEEFQIPRDLFSSSGDAPNYFTLGFGAFFTSPTEVFPGLSQPTLLRPPSILPPSVPNKSAETFADLLHILKGYPVGIRNEEHPADLLRDARYFHLKGLEQKLIPHSISYNLAREVTEIVVRLEDIRQSGISFVADSSPAAASKPQSTANNTTSNHSNGPGWVYYQRPYVDAEVHSLIVEISGEENTSARAADGTNVTQARFGRAQYHRQALSRITSLFNTVADKMNLQISQPLGFMLTERGDGVGSPSVLSGNIDRTDARVKVRIGSDTDVVVDSRPWYLSLAPDPDNHRMPSGGSSKSGKESGPADPGGRSAIEVEQQAENWVLKRAQWKLRAQPLPGDGRMAKDGFEIILDAVKIEAYRSERGRNQGRGFLM